QQANGDKQRQAIAFNRQVQWLALLCRRFQLVNGVPSSSKLLGVGSTEKPATGAVGHAGQQRFVQFGRWVDGARTKQAGHLQAVGTYADGVNAQTRFLGGSSGLFR